MSIIIHSVECKPQKAKRKGLWIIVDRENYKLLLTEGQEKYAGYWSEEYGGCYSAGALVVRVWTSKKWAEIYRKRNDIWTGMVIPQEEHFTFTSRLYDSAGIEISP